MIDRKLLTSLLLVAATAVLLIATESRVSWLDDEVTILDVARTPASQTLKLFSTAFGQHEHPPLSDLVLHYWISLIGNRLSDLRILNILIYCFGGTLLVLAAKSSTVPNADICTAALFLLSPFGYHFGRMFGWYSFSFAAVAALTYCLVKMIVSPANRNYLGELIVASTILVYVNYLGWIVIALASGIYVSSNTAKRRAVQISGLWVAVTALFYLPMWRVILHQIPLSVHPSSSVLSKMANFVYAVNVLALSEAVAPWAGWLGLFASLLTMVLAASIAYKNERLGRTFFLGSLILVLAMSASGSLFTKRLIIAYPWFLLAFSLFLARMIRSKNIPLIAISVAVLSIAWFGIVTKRFYSAFHSIEPWSNEASIAVEMLTHNWLVVSNSEVFLFYLTYALRNPSLPPSPFMGVVGNEIKVPGVIFISGFSPSFAGTKKVRFVEGANRYFIAQSASTLSWLTHNCRTLATERDLTDEGFELKKRLFPEAGQVQFRIVNHNFDCNLPSTIFDKSSAALSPAKFH